MVRNYALFLTRRMCDCDALRQSSGHMARWTKRGFVTAFTLAAQRLALHHRRKPPIARLCAHRA